MRSDNYNSGKAGERQTWDYLRGVGYVRPTKHQRAKIVAAFERRGLSVHERGFDVVSADVMRCLNSAEVLVEDIDRLLLFEVKTCGANRKAQVSGGFKGLGFTLTD